MMEVCSAPHSFTRFIFSGSGAKLAHYVYLQRTVAVFKHVSQVGWSRTVTWRVLSKNIIIFYFQKMAEKKLS